MASNKVPPERRKEIAAMGGRAAQASGKAHKFTGEEKALARQRAAERSPEWYERDIAKRLARLDKGGQS